MDTTAPTDPGPAKKKIRRSRLGCHQCKRFKIKCNEERPKCANCIRIGKPCDYSLKLTWGGRPFKNKERRKPAFPEQVSRSDGQTVLAFVSNDMDTSKANGKAGVKPNRRSSTVQVKKEPVNDSEVAPPAADAPSSTATTYTVVKSDEDSQFEYQSVNAGNSEIFSSFVATQMSQNMLTASEDSSITVHLPLLADLYDNYSADIARIESSFPEERPSVEYGHGFWPKRSSEEPEGQLVHTPTNPQNDPVNFYKDDETDALAQLNEIPPSLTPLPELLMNVPYYKLLLHFWVNVAAENLVPAPSHMYHDNPFKILLPQMAMHYPGVLTTILAFAARARSTLDGAGSDHQEIIDQLLGRSCNELLKQLQDKEESTSDGTLATILLLSCYEVVNSNDFEKHRTHTTGASQIISARRIKAPDSPGSDDSDSVHSSGLLIVKIKDESDIAFFLMRWFAYVDVLGALSSTRGRENYLRAYRKRGKYTPVESIFHIDVNSAYTRGHRTDIDYLLGFDVRLLPHFINIALLIGEVEGMGADTSKLPIEIITAALELKERFTQGYEEGEEKRQKTIDLMIESRLKVKKSTSPRSARNIKELVDHDNILRATNKLFFDMGLLNLYRRVLLLPRLSPLVQDLADNMAEVLEYGVELRSPAEICTIFCHFCAGCETLDQYKRQFFFERFTKLAHDGNINATKSLVIMNRCWETGEDWITAANALDIDLVLM